MARSPLTPLPRCQRQVVEALRLQPLIRDQAQQPLPQRPGVGILHPPMSKRVCSSDKVGRPVWESRPSIASRLITRQHQSATGGSGSSPKSSHRRRRALRRRQPGQTPSTRRWSRSSGWARQRPASSSTEPHRGQRSTRQAIPQAGAWRAPGGAGRGTGRSAPFSALQRRQGPLTSGTPCHPQAPHCSRLHSAIVPTLSTIAAHFSDGIPTERR